MKVLDYDYKLNTAKKNTAEIETELIEGKLCALIITTNKKCEILVCFKEADIVVYRNMEFFGEKYIPINLQTLTPDNQLLLSGSESFYLNNNLIIKIFGAIDTEVEITLRVI